MDEIDVVAKTHFKEAVAKEVLQDHFLNNSNFGARLSGARALGAVKLLAQGTWMQQAIDQPPITRWTCFVIVLTRTVWEFI